MINLPLEHIISNDLDKFFKIVKQILKMKYDFFVLYVFIRIINNEFR